MGRTMRRYAANALLALAGLYLVAASLWLCLISIVADLPVGEWIEGMTGWYDWLRELLTGE